MKVSLIVTVKNEAGSLPRLLDSIAEQSRAPDEIIIADGGSTDCTLEILNSNTSRLPLKILSVPGANISQGRNAAIRAASGEVICSTDAGVRLHKEWVKEITRLFENTIRSNDLSRRQTAEAATTTDVVSGFFIPDPRTIFETALAATTLPVLSDIRADKFLPSSRSIAYRKSAWEKVGGYPEWLDYCEDLIFDFALCAAGLHFEFAPNAVAYFRPRANLRAFFKQYYQYARGDGKANLWFMRYIIRYATYLLALPLTTALLFSPAWFLGFGFLIFCFSAMLYTPYRRLLPMLRGFSTLDKIRAIASVPIIRVAGDVAKMIGYPVGVAWTLHHKILL